VLAGKTQAASELLPRMHLIASLLKRWLLGTHQGAVSRAHLDLLPGRVHIRGSTDRARKAEASCSTGSCSRQSP